MTAANPDLASDTCPVSCWCHRTDLTDLPWPAARWTPDAPTGVTDPNPEENP